MSDYDQKELREKFRRIGITKGDSVFLTTSLGSLGVPKTKNNENQKLNWKRLKVKNSGSNRNYRKQKILLPIIQLLI